LSRCARSSRQKLFAVNPKYAADEALLGKVTKALEKIVPEDFIVLQEERARYVITDEVLAQVFSKKAPREVLELCTSMSCKPQLAHTDINRILDFVCGLLTAPRHRSSGERAADARRGREAEEGEEGGGMKYDAYAYLWPPRPESAIPRDTLGFYERRGWCAQVKKNGTCTVIFARDDEVVFKTRHDTDHRAWTPLPDHRRFFSYHLRFDRWCVLVAELLHSKTERIKNHLYVFDVLVHDGAHLVGKTFAQRQALLRELLPPVPSGALSYGLGLAGVGSWQAGPCVSVAATYSGAFNDLWTQLRTEDEGLVLKDPNAPLKPCFTAIANAGWQVKCRRSTKNYSF
jgi:hypothetical protein